MNILSDDTFFINGFSALVSEHHAEHFENPLLKNGDVDIVSFLGMTFEQIKRCLLNNTFQPKVAVFASERQFRLVCNIRFCELLYFIDSRVSMDFIEAFKFRRMEFDNSQERIKLTLSEREVIMFLRKGRSISFISSLFKKSPKTIYALKKNAMTKMGVYSDIELFTKMCLVERFNQYY
ncbi:hypothetical protein [Enterobacter roggenkampii]|uniref:hypothetical protein n=1 Tax=Enterobacter roggenkampii TaxID=1812935 RepID=UPI0021CF514E|nr:hypothetical protein [Enterobacter roggenkampii]MCU6180282.1 LuxR C-terminal-related transcriptional regulator [Enterobacter roggenkampii]